MDYHPNGEMIVSANTRPDDENRHFLHQVRYWMEFDSGTPLGVGKVARNANGTEITHPTADFMWTGL